MTWTGPATAQNLHHNFMQTAQLLLWVLVLTGILSLAHFYLWRRLVRDPAWPPRWARWATGGMLALLLSQPLLLLLARDLPREVIGPWAMAAFVWMGLLSSLFTLLLFVEIIRGSTRLFRGLRRGVIPAVPPSVERLDRRQAINRIVAGGVVLGGSALTGAGVAEALGPFTIKRLDVELRRLPEQLDGFRIVQLTDVHVGPTIGRDFVTRMVNAANAQEPDLIAITGDLVDGSVAHLSRHTEPLAGLKSRHGSFFVTGNHEYYSGVDEWVAEVERLGIEVLRNRRVSIERNGASFDLAGVTDHKAARYGDAPDYERALGGRDPSREVVLLAHQPAALDEASRAGVGLMLSGHTHGGQFWPWTWVAALVHPVLAGLARFGETQVYVSCGTGYWGPPVRIGTQSEITVITLRSGQRMELA